MKDLVVGAITGYNFQAIEPWVNSLDRCGFEGDKAMFCYNISYDVADQLNKRGYKVFGFERNDEERMLEYSKPGFNIVVERFMHMWGVLQQFKGQYRYIIATDVKDVVFQRNPSEWMTINFGMGVFENRNKINAASESIVYEQEEWGRMNLFRSFGPQFYQAFNDKVISNAGVMSGDFETMLDLFMNIKLLCDAAPAHFIEGGGGPDQAAYNILINSKPFKDITRFTMSEDGWAAQLGTTGPQIDYKYGDKLVEPKPILKDGKVCTSTGEPFYIVHQYDRVPEWKPIIMEQYK